MMDNKARIPNYGKYILSFNVQAVSVFGQDLLEMEAPQATTHMH